MADSGKSTVGLRPEDARTPSGAERDGDPAPGVTDRLYVVAAFGIQIALVAFFALRTWALETALEVGWIVYALAIPAVAVSIILIRSGRPWYLWIAGFAYAGWAALGFAVDVARPIDWRWPIVWPIFLPYVALYLAAQMFYWWPLARFDRRLWAAYAVLFLLSTGLNIGSHG